jgi:methylphosphotriester-DNA--protein-cysteine methyltransferase
VVCGPVDAGMVLSKVVYPAYILNPDVKEEIEEVLYDMLSQTDYDVYIVALYVMSELFKEKYEITPFQMDTEKILKRLRKELQERKTSFQSGLKLPNGYIKKSVWEELVRFDQVAQEEYGISLLS